MALSSLSVTTSGKASNNIAADITYEWDIPLSAHLMDNIRPTSGLEEVPNGILFKGIAMYGTP